MNGMDAQGSISHGNESLHALVHLGVVMRCKRWSCAYGASVRALEHRQLENGSGCKDSELRTGAAPH